MYLIDALVPLWKIYFVVLWYRSTLDKKSYFKQDVTFWVSSIKSDYFSLLSDLCVLEYWHEIKGTVSRSLESNLFRVRWNKPPKYFNISSRQILHFSTACPKYLYRQQCIHSSFFKINISGNMLILKFRQFDGFPSLNNIKIANISRSMTSQRIYKLHKFFFI